MASIYDEIFMCICFYSSAADVTSESFSLFVSCSLFTHNILPFFRTHPRRDASAQKKQTNSAKRRRCVGVESRPACGVTPGYPVSAPKSAECSLHCLLPSVGSLDKNQGLTHEFM